MIQRKDRIQEPYTRTKEIIVKKRKMEYTYYNYVNYAENYEVSKEKVFMKVE